MDLYRIVNELHVEKQKLDHAIIFLEELQRADRAEAKENRRGRKPMNALARKQVSERMKKYWAERRAAAST
ncbi:MAG: hypothetical protein EXQ52_06030 [Bryobacterales bacterium]|nr:hypothetical protein [Bryobacterales bacterium]